MMRSYNFFIFFLILFIGNSVPIESHQIGSNVTIIPTEDDLITKLSSTKPTIIMGQMENCPHCKVLTPVFTSLAEKYPKIQFFKTNGQKTKMHLHVKEESNGKYLIPGYPSMIFINNGKITNLLIGGNKEKLMQYISEFIKNNSSSSKLKVK